MVKFRKGADYCVEGLLLLCGNRHGGGASFCDTFVVPENFTSKENEYLYLEFPSAEIEERYLKEALDETDISAEEVTVKIGKEELPATLYETDEQRLYLFDKEEDMIKAAEGKHKLGAAIVMGDNYEIHITYYTQGNETEKFVNLLKIFHGENDAALYDKVETQKVETISTDYLELTDRENLMPVFMTFNGALMGLFIMAAYIFLDKKEGVIKAFAITPTPVWKYLFSKMLMLTATTLVTSLIIVVPVMGTRVNYLLLVLFLVPTGFFASVLGLLLAGYFDDIIKSFGVLYLLMIGMMLPAFSYYIPTWDPLWVKFIPSYYIIYGFKEIFIKGDTSYILLISLGYLAVSFLLFIWANMRHKRTLSV